MKRILCAFVALLPMCVSAQTTPTLHFNIPPEHSTGWAPKINANFTLLDNYLSGQTTLSSLNLTGTITVGIDPINNLQVATKQYVDTHTPSFAPASGDISGTYPALTVVKINGQTPATVATSGSYTDLTNKPSLALTPLFAFQGYGDSYVLGLGATTPAIGSGFAQLARTIPAVPANNNGVSGLNSDSINFNVWTMVQPSPQQASAYLFNSGSNDDHNCGVSASCLANFSETANASIGYLAIPNQERVFGSACTQTSGTWTADTTAYPIPAPTYYLNPGTAVSASGTGAILTCTVLSRTTSTKVGLNFQVTNAQAGTFTVSVDGVPQTDSCSGTTTFTSAPCGANLLTRTTVIFRQEFTGTPGTSHTVLITTTNASKVDVTAVDAITSFAQANSNYVAVLGPNAGFDTSNTYNALLSSIANQFASDGSRVAFADQQSTTPGPGVNNTTDTATTATANCTASTQSSHPNDICGYFHLAQTVVNATKAAGWNIFGTPQAFNTPVGQTIVANAGSNAAPSLTSSVDTTTGFYIPQAGRMEWASGGFDNFIFLSAKMTMRSNYVFRWNSGNPSTTGEDLGFGRIAAGVMCFDTTTAGNCLGSVKVANVQAGIVYSAAGTALPSCVAGLKGTGAVVGDATSPTYLGAYTSGGTVVSAVLCNGTSWVTH